MMKVRRATSALTAASLLSVGGCSGLFSNFENRPGDIYAGYPSTVTGHWFRELHAGKTTVRGYLYFLWTEDCPPDKEPTPGLGKITAGCEEKATNVDTSTYTGFKDGDGIVWERGFPWEQDKHGIVEGHSQEWGNGKIAYLFAFLVRQCGVVTSENPSGTCVEDFVEVDDSTYSKYPDNTELTWPGSKDTIVSQH